MLGLNFDKIGTNSCLTHNLDMSAKMRRGKWLKRALMVDVHIDNLFKPNFGYENLQKIQFNE